MKMEHSRDVGDTRWEGNRRKKGKGGSVPSNRQQCPCVAACARTIHGHDSANISLFRSRMPAYRHVSRCRNACRNVSGMCIGMYTCVQACIWKCVQTLQWVCGDRDVRTRPCGYVYRHVHLAHFSHRPPYCMCRLVQMIPAVSIRAEPVLVCLPVSRDCCLW